jgi:glycosyltransferase involved in cell wall biosynthesis
MRLLIAAGEWFPDRASGYARVVTETARRLAERGHEVTVLVPSFEGAPSVAIDGSLTVRRQLRRGRLPVTFTDVIGTRRHARSSAASRFDLFVAHGPTNGFGLVAGRLEGPLVFVYHASTVREQRFMRSRLPLGRERIAAMALEPPLAFYERATVARADQILVLSEYSRRLLVGDHPHAAAKVRRVSGGVDTAVFSPADQREARERLGIPANRRLLLTVRRLELRMGIEELLRALSRLSRTIHLAVVGEGMLAPTLRRVAEELGLAGRVHFAGLVSEPELIDWYRAADLFVLPTVAYEGFGLATAEALACGTPVVGTAVGATPELLRPLDPRLVASAPEAEALANAVANALTFANPELRARCRRYACGQFSWESVVDAWEEALVEAAKTNARSRPPARPAMGGATRSRS